MEVLFRPDRKKYVRSDKKEKKECVFCSANQAGVGFSRLVLLQTDTSLVIMNKYPYNTGHLLILPRAHVGELPLLSDQQAASLHWLLRESARIVQEAYQCPGMNIGLNQGSAAGAGIPQHLHYHLIPRWRGDTNFFPLIADSKVVIESLKETFKRLSPHFKKLRVKGH